MDLKPGMPLNHIQFPRQRNTWYDETINPHLALCAGQQQHPPLPGPVPHRYNRHASFIVFALFNNPRIARVVCAKPQTRSRQHNR